MELGGKSPLVIFDDVDLDNAVNVTLAANFYNNGQVCSNATRLIVHEKIVDAFCSRLVEKVGRLKVGGAMEQVIERAKRSSLDEKDEKRFTNHY